MRRLTVALTLLALAALAGSAGAFTLAEWERYGYTISTYDARTLAMGGAGLASAEGARGLTVNPALLGKTEGIDIALSGMLVLAEESRETPLHDSFDGVIAYTTYALNTEVYDRYVGSIAFRPDLDMEWMPVVAVGYGPRIDMSYGYHVQYRDPDFATEPADKILYDYYIEGDGGINAFSVGLGQEVYPDVYVGLDVDFLRGEYDVSERWVYPIDSDEEDVDAFAEYNDVAGTQFSLGVLYEGFHRVDLAAVYRGSFTLEGDYDIRTAGGERGESGNFEYKYPSSLGLGIEYHPRNELMTKVSCDVEFTQWSEFEDSLLDEDPGLDDTVTYRIGVEHAFFDDTLARFGFTYRPSYIEESNTTAAFSAGLGLDVLGVRVDIGGQVGLRDYDIDEGRVRETTTLAMATLTRTF